MCIRIVQKRVDGRGVERSLRASIRATHADLTRSEPSWNDDDDSKSGRRKLAPKKTVVFWQSDKSRNSTFANYVPNMQALYVYYKNEHTVRAPKQERNRQIKPASLPHTHTCTQYTQYGDSITFRNNFGRCQRGKAKAKKYALNHIFKDEDRFLIRSR